MSGRAVGGVLAHADRRLRGGLLLVAVALAEHANAHHEAWPSRATLARETRLHPRTVQRALHRLVQLGVIATVRQGVGRSRTTRVKLLVQIGLHVKGGTTPPFPGAAAEKEASTTRKGGILPPPKSIEPLKREPLIEAPSREDLERDLAKLNLSPATAQRFRERMTQPT